VLAQANEKVALELPWRSSQ